MKEQRRSRIARAVERGNRRSDAFFATPWAAVVCMLVALGSIIGYWRGVPRWALLAMGIGAIVILVLAGYAWRAGRRSPKA